MCVPFCPSSPMSESVAVWSLTLASGDAYMFTLLCTCSPFDSPVSLILLCAQVGSTQEDPMVKARLDKLSLALKGQTCRRSRSVSILSLSKWVLRSPHILWLTFAQSFTNTIAVEHSTSVYHSKEEETSSHYELDEYKMAH